MPLSKLQFRPGINREATTYSNEGGYFEGDKVRFRSGFPEKIGGWINQSFGYTFKGVARALLNWVTLNGTNLLAVGTNKKQYVENGGVYNDITPVVRTVTLGASPISVTDGSYLVTVTDAGFNSTIGTFVTFSGATAVGGITLSGNYEIVSSPTATTYTVISSVVATSTTTGGGAAVVAAYEVNAGNATYSTGTGWGVVPWGGGAWGSASSTSIPMRVGSETTYGENLVFAYQRGPIYYWDVDTSTYARAVSLQDAANAMTKVTVAGTSAGVGTTITVTDTTYIDVGSVVAGTNVVAGTYVTAINFSTLVVTLSAATSGAASGNYTFSYAGRHVPHTTEQIFSADISKFIVALGANPYGPGAVVASPAYDPFNLTFDPMLVRWSDQDNIFEWVPAVINQSGEQRLSNGSYLVCAQNMRQEILIWSDAAVYSMQYLGPPYVFGFTLLMDNISIASPRAVVTANNIAHWMGVDKFYVYSGRVETLPCTLRKFVFQNINKDQLNQVVSGTNEGFNEIWWFYPSAGSLVNDSYVIFNYLEQVWYYGTLNRSAWLDSPLRSYPMAAFSVQNSYLASTLTSGATSVSLLNGMTYPAEGTVVIESEEIAYTGVSGNNLTGCTRGANGTTATSHAQYMPVTFKTPNQIMFHEVGTDDFSEATARAIEAYIGSSDFDIGDGHNLGFVWRILPDLTFEGSTAGSPQAVLTLTARQDSGSGYIAGNNPAVTRTATIPVEQYTGQVYTRLRGRQMRFRLDSTEKGTAWQMGAMRIDIRPDGRR